MSVPSIEQIAGAIPRVGPIGIGGTDGAAATQGVNEGFAAQLGQGIDQMQATQSNVNDLAVQAATGDLTDVHDYLIASTESGLRTQLTMAVRNKAVEAFNEIMRMQA